MTKKLESDVKLVRFARIKRKKLLGIREKVASDLKNINSELYRMHLILDAFDNENYQKELSDEKLMQSPCPNPPTISE